MTTLPLRANTLPSFSPVALVGRVAAVFSMVIDVYAEALQQANDARSATRSPRLNRFSALAPVA